MTKVAFPYAEPVMTKVAFVLKTLRSKRRKYRKKDEGCPSSAFFLGWLKERETASAARSLHLGKTAQDQWRTFGPLRRRELQPSVELPSFWA
jgi:hypothetical protein